MDNQQGDRSAGGKGTAKSQAAKCLSLSLSCLGCPTYTMGWTSPLLGSQLHPSRTRSPQFLPTPDQTYP